MEFRTEGTRVNYDRFCATLRSLKQRIRRIRPERNKFLLLHDNARPRYNAQTQEAMRSLKFTVVPHPPYSPDLAPSDFWLFPKLKETLKGQYFSSVDEVEAAVRKWIRSQPENFFVDGMNKWIERLKKMCSPKWWLCWKISVHRVSSGFGGLDVRVLVQTRPKPSDFSGEKFLSAPSFGGEVKPSVPCRKFAACKRTQKWRGSRHFRQNSRQFIAHSSTFRCWGSLASSQVAGVGTF